MPTNNTTYKHGVFTTISGTYGKCQNIKVNKSTSTDTGKDEIGNTIDYADYEPITKVTATFLWPVASTEPVPGDVITVTPANPTTTAFKIKLDTVDLSEENEKFKMLEIAGTRWVANSLPA